MLHFTIKFTNDSNGKTYFAEVPCKDTKQAHENAAHIAVPGEIVRVYPTLTDSNGKDIVDGIEAGAIMVLRRTTANMIKRGIKDASRLKRISVSKNSYEWTLYTEARRDKITFADAEDIISIAQLALIDGIRHGLTIDEIYHGAFLEVNKYVGRQGRIAKITSYIEDPLTGEIVNVNHEICRLIKPGEPLTFEALTGTDGDTDGETVGTVDSFIKQLTGELTRTQQNVLKLLAYGWSQNQTAEHLKISKQAISKHIKLIRQAAFKICPNGFDTFRELFTDTDV